MVRRTTDIKNASIDDVYEWIAGKQMTGLEFHIWVRSQLNVANISGYEDGRSEVYNVGNDQGKDK